MPVEPNLKFIQQKKALLKLHNRTLQRALRSLDKCKADLHHCRHWEEAHHQAELLQANLYKIKRGAQSVTVDDWLSGNKKVLPLDREVEPHEQVQLLFKKSSKLKKGIPFMERQVERMEKEVARLSTQLETIEASETEEQLLPFAPSEKKPKLTPESEKIKRYREYTTHSGLKILVGKGAKDNDELTFKIANGNDWWLHVNGYPGSHVILKPHKNEDPDPQSIKEAAQVALFHSKAKDHGEAEVCVTQCKYIKKAPGLKPGQVQVSKHKNIKIRLNLEEIKKLK